MFSIAMVVRNKQEARGRQEPEGWTDTHTDSCRVWKDVCLYTASVTPSGWKVDKVWNTFNTVNLLIFRSGKICNIINVIDC